MSKQLTWILAVCVAFFAGSQLAMGQYYVGCGTLKDRVKCDGCLGIPDNCGCVNNNCKNDQVVCTSLPAAWDLCETNGQFDKIYEAQSKCHRRKRCNNSLGQDLGDCTLSPHTCQASGEFIYFGPYRTYYYKEGTCECIIAHRASELMHLCQVPSTRVSAIPERGRHVLHQMW